MSFLSLFMEYQNILDLKYNIIDIANAIYSKNHRLTNNNIYSSLIYDAYDYEQDSSGSESTHLSYDTSNEEIEDKYLIFKNKINFDKINSINVLTNEQLKNIIIETKNLVYSKKYNDIEKNEAIIKNLENIENGISRFISITEDKLNLLLKHVNKIFYNDIILKLVSENKQDKAVLVMITYYNRIVLWPSNLMILDLDENILKLRTRDIKDKKYYLRGDFDEDRANLYRSNNIILKYISSVDSYSYIYFNKCKYADLFFVLDIFDFFDSIKNNKDLDKTTIEEINSLITSYIEYEFNLKISDLFDELNQIKDELNKELTEQDQNHIQEEACSQYFCKL